MFPEDGRLRVCGVREDGVTPFTQDAPLRNRKFADSPLEETVRSELVSEMGCRVRQKLTRIPASLWMITEG
jgi:hypothetical protein